MADDLQIPDRRHGVDRRIAPFRRGGRRDDDPAPEWVSISEFGRLWGADRKKVHKWLRSQILEAYRVGRYVRIRNLRPDLHHPTDPTPAAPQLK